MEMTFQHYIENPLGKSNAALTITRRDYFKKTYEEKYGAILLRENGKFEYALYIDKSKDRYFIHIKIPSELVEKFYYDIVVEFYPLDIAAKTAIDLRNYGVKFFSNDPSFVFTYAYVFNKYDLFIKELSPRMVNKALKDKPDTRNPWQIPGYVKSLYFCYLYMKGKGLFDKSHWERFATPFILKNLIHDIEPADKKISDRQELGIEAIKKRKEKNKEAFINNLKGNQELKKHYGKHVEDNSIVKVIKPKAPIARTNNVSRIVKAIKKK